MAFISFLMAIHASIADWLEAEILLRWSVYNLVESQVRKYYKFRNDFTTWNALYSYVYQYTCSSMNFQLINAIGSCDL